MEKDNLFTQASIEPKLFYSKKVRKLQQKWICDKTASNVFYKKYEQNKTATHL